MGVTKSSLVFDPRLALFLLSEKIVKKILKPGALEAVQNWASGVKITASHSFGSLAPSFGNILTSTICVDDSKQIGIRHTLALSMVSITVDA